MVVRKDKLLVSSIRKIKNTYRRFLSLLCMSLLGVGFFAGIKATSPDMLKSLDLFMDNQNVYDIEIVSILGSTENDIEKIKQIESVDNAYGVYSKDEIVSSEKKEYVVKLIGERQNINNIYLTSGSLPAENNEIVVEEKFLNRNNLKIGDIVSVEDNELLVQEFKIVGTVISPLYFSIDRGTSSKGKGQIDYYMYVKEEVFEQEYFNSIYVKVKGAAYSITSTDEYEKLVDDTIKEIENIKEEREENRYSEVYGEYINQMQIANIQIDTTTLTPSKWYILSRNDNTGYKNFIDATENIEKIGNVFPLVFYIIAILISLISMMRMVEEDRTEIGTLKALGFSNIKIIMKYIIYSLSATIIGGIIGMIIGCSLLPNIIWNIYQMLFSVPNFVCEFSLTYGIIGLIIGIICICGTTIYVAKKELKNTPSVLMRPKAPKVGKRNLVEKITFIWKKIKFSKKVTVRNLFRYKTRALATIIGIAGCTALILAGFGLKDSIKDIVNYQFGKVFTYDKMINIKSNVDSTELVKNLEENDDITNVVATSMESIDIYKGETEKEATLVVTDEEEKLKNVINLNNIENKEEKVELEDNTIVISEKLAKLLDVKEGEEITLKDENENEYTLKVKNIVENYVNHYAYLTKKTYEEIYGEYNTNVILISTNSSLTEEQKNKLDEQIMNNEIVSGIISSEDTVKTVTDMMGSLDSVVLILIISAALLAFVVLYNLSNINISERKREIATLKVLGFYNQEVDSYITRENIILTMLGIVIGLVAGLYLSYFMITTCEIDTLMFVRHVKPISYVISTFITVIFTIIVNIITHFSLKKIDMIESLKNVE